MKPKAVLIILISCGVLAAVAYLVSGPSQPVEQQRMGRPFFEALPVDQIAAIRLESPEEQVHLTKGTRIWEVANRGNYPADFTKISDLVRKLEQMKIDRTFAATPELIDRLGLHPPDATEAARGTRLTLTDAKQQPLADLILGDPPDPGSSALTQYVLQADADIITTVDQDLRFLDKRPADWLNKELLNIGREQIHKLVCHAADGGKTVYTLERDNPEEPLVLKDLPAGRKLSSAQVDKVSGALSDMRIDDVAEAARANEPSPEQGQRLDYHLFDGTTLHIYIGPQVAGAPDQNYFRVQIEQDTAKSATDKTDQQEQSAADLFTPQRIQQIQGWTYIVSDWMKEQFISSKEGLLEDSSS